MYSKEPYKAMHDITVQNTSSQLFFSIGIRSKAVTLALFILMHHAIFCILIFSLAVVLSRG